MSTIAKNLGGLNWALRSESLNTLYGLSLLAPVTDLIVIRFSDPHPLTTAMVKKL